MTVEKRIALLRAGVEAIIDEGYKLLRGGLSLDHLVERSGVSKETFRKEFPNQVSKGGLKPSDRFLEELLSSLVIDNPRSTKSFFSEEFSGKLIESNGDPLPAMRELCKQNFEQVRADLATRIRLFIITSGRSHKGALKALRDEYREVINCGAHAYKQILLQWGATLRKPFTTELAAAVFMAIVEGLTLQWLVDPDAVPESLFGDAVVVFTAALVDMEQRQEHIDDVATASFANEVMRDFQLSGREGEIENPRKVIIEAAVAEFTRRGFFATELKHVAATARVELRTLKRLFPHTVDLVVGGLKPAFEQLKASVADNKTLKMSATEVLGRYLRDLVTLFIDNRAMADALLVIMSRYVMHAPEMEERVRQGLDFPSLITPTIEAGQQAGTFSTGSAAAEVAAMLVNNLLLWCSTRRSHTAEEIARDVSALCLHGLLTKK